MSYRMICRPDSSRHRGCAVYFSGFLLFIHKHWQYAGMNWHRTRKSKATSVTMIYTSGHMHLQYCHAWLIGGTMPKSTCRVFRLFANISPCSPGKTFWDKWVYLASIKCDYLSSKGSSYSMDCMETRVCYYPTIYALSSFRVFSVSSMIFRVFMCA